MFWNLENLIEIDLFVSMHMISRQVYYFKVFPGESFAIEARSRTPWLLLAPPDVAEQQPHQRRRRRQRQRQRRRRRCRRPIKAEMLFLKPLTSSAAVDYFEITIVSTSEISHWYQQQQQRQRRRGNEQTFFTQLSDSFWQRCWEHLAENFTFGGNKNVFLFSVENFSKVNYDPGVEWAACATFIHSFTAKKSIY